MKISDNGLELIKRFEGIKLDAYLDGGGVPSIGFGHTKDVFLGDSCSRSDADDWLRDDVHHAENDVNQMVSVPLTQNEFDALVSFVFNLGGHAFRGSTLLKRLNAGDYDLAAAEFERWNKDNGKVVAGLTRRREAEKELFET